MLRKVIIFSLLLVFVVVSFVNFSYAELTIEPSGNVGIGTTDPTPTNSNTVTPLLVVSGSGVKGAAQVVRHTSVGGGGAILGLSATRGTDADSHTVLQSGDGVGAVIFGGSDGTRFINSATIKAQVDGTPGTNDMPGRLIFGTTADGAAVQTERMRIDSSGRVGIGTTDPTPTNHNTVTPLFVVSGSGVNGAAQVVRHTSVGGGGAILELSATRGTDADSHTVLQNGDGVGAVSFGGSDGTQFIGAASVVAQVDGTPGTNDMPGRLIFATGGVAGQAERMRIDSSGRVGIGTTSPSHPLEMGSGAHVTSGGVWTNASSREYKNNIRNLTFEEAKTALEELTPTRYHYNVDNEDEYLGFIAEDVPDLVATKDRKGLSPMDIVAVLTKVVQQQQKKIEGLEARFNICQ